MGVMPLASRFLACSGIARAVAELLRTAMLAMTLRTMEWANMLLAVWHIVSTSRQSAFVE